jgi:Tfp pilus assembly protein PilX
LPAASLHHAAAQRAARAGISLAECSLLLRALAASAPALAFADAATPAAVGALLTRLNAPAAAPPAREAIACMAATQRLVAADARARAAGGGGGVGGGGAVVAQTGVMLGRALDLMDESGGGGEGEGVSAQRRPSLTQA